MKAWKTVIAVVAIALLAGSSPMSASHYSAQPPQQEQAQAQSASGKVLNVTPTSLTIEVPESGQPRSLDFVIDSNTKINGKVAKNASVQVTYRIEDGKNIATVVRVV